MRRREGRNRLRLSILVLASALAVASGALAQEAAGSGFAVAKPGYELHFPRDHGSHDAYRTEWWYFTGQLRTAGGKRFGFELTFFRVAVLPPGTPSVTRWDVAQIMPAHFAITDISNRKFRYYEKLNRASPYTAGAATGRLDVFNEGWRATTNPDGSWRIIAAEGSDSIDLTLRSRKAPAPHGDDGLSIKAEGLGYASHYYSMTRLEISGSVNGERGTGLGWMDHEFGSFALRENQQGWDWFSIQLDNDTELMLYVIRRTDGSPDVTSSGSVVTSDGRVIPIRHDQMRIRARESWTSPKSGAKYPMRWLVDVPGLNIALDVRPLMKEQELVTGASTGITYWEGAIETSGSFGGTSVRGGGYVEMTGYDRKFRAPKPD